MRHYEIAVVLHPDLEIDIETPLKKVEQIISEAGGTVDKKDNWGKRKLAYRINGQDWGVFVFYQVSLPPSSVSGIENNLKITEEVMRHLIVSLETIKPVTRHKPGKVAGTGPKPTAKPKAEDNKEVAADSTAEDKE